MKSYAFFDLDGTLIKIKSMMSFLHYCCDRKLVAHDYSAALSLLQRHYKEGASREKLNSAYYKLYRGGQWEDIVTAGERWYETLDLDELFYSNVVARLQRHQRQGQEAVIVSGSFEPCVAPLARYLDITHTLTAEPEVKNGSMTGELKQQTIGAGKAEAMAGFLKHNRAEADLCYAYGDDVSDIPMLSFVGNPCVVGNTKSMTDEAARNGWRSIDV